MGGKVFNFYVKVSSDPIHLAQLELMLDDPSHGARIIFSGSVRNFNQGKKVFAVSYDAFIPLTEKCFLEICNEARDRWGASLKAVIAHRVGKLTISEMSVAIGVSLPHRRECYQASRYIIEELKTRAPIWKKETYEDGESEWLQGHALCSHD